MTRNKNETGTKLKPQKIINNKTKNRNLITKTKTTNRIFE